MMHAWSMNGDGAFSVDRSAGWERIPMHARLAGWLALMRACVRACKRLHHACRGRSCVCSRRQCAHCHHYASCAGRPAGWLAGRPESQPAVAGAPAPVKIPRPAGANYYVGRRGRRACLPATVDAHGPAAVHWAPRPAVLLAYAACRPVPSPTYPHPYAPACPSACLPASRHLVSASCSCCFFFPLPHLSQMHAH